MTSTTTEVPAKPSSFGNLDLFVEIDSRPDPRWRKIFTSSVFAHLIGFVLFMSSPGFVSEPPRRLAQRHVVPLYLPPQLLTQKARNKQEPSRSIDLAALMSPAPSSPRAPHFEVPSAAPSRPAPSPALQPAPAVGQVSPTAAVPAGVASGMPAPPAPPPPAPSSEPFENLGQDSHPDIPRRKIEVPNSSVDHAIKSLAQGSANGRIRVDDSGAPGSLGHGTAPHAEVELQSDPAGVDFREYLTRILSIVRANWRQVLPESARMGLLRGSTQVEFIIDRDGSIPKLVTAEESGSRALDTAAVAGLSMSNPLPPLPQGFKGQQVRVAFTFSVSGKP